MSLFDIFKKKKAANAADDTADFAEALMAEEAQQEVAPEEAEAVVEDAETVDDEKAEPAAEAVSKTVLIGVLDTDILPDSDDLMIIGTLRGTVRKGDTLTLSHPGTDSEPICEIAVTDLCIESGCVESATNTQVVLRLENASRWNIRPGYVLHSKEATPGEVKNAYIAALGDTYVSRRDLQLVEEEFEGLTLTDCAEIFRLYTWFHGKTMQTGADEQKAQLMSKLQIFSERMAQKLVQEPVLYCPYSKATGKPYLFSRVARQGEDGLVCSPPSVLVFTKAYHKTMATHFDDERFTLKEIVNDERQKEVTRFFRECICVNGAAGVCILSEQTGLPAKQLVPEGDMKAMGEYATVSNPEVMRYVLLMEQIGKPSTQDEETIYKLYYSYLARAIRSARFLVPVKSNKKLPQMVLEGKMPLPKDAKVALSTIQGKNGRPAVCLYTDRLHLRASNASGQECLLKSVPSLIGQFDCVINLTPDGKSGCYINAEMFEDMKKYE